MLPDAPRYCAHPGVHRTARERLVVSHGTRWNKDLRRSDSRVTASGPLEWNALPSFKSRANRARHGICWGAMGGKRQRRALPHPLGFSTLDTSGPPQACSGHPGHTTGPPEGSEGIQGIRDTPAESSACDTARAGALVVEADSTPEGLRELHAGLRAGASDRLRLLGEGSLGCVPEVSRSPNGVSLGGVCHNG